MHQIIGRVVVKGSDIGVHALLVTALAAAVDTPRRNSRQARPAGNRLGSVITDSNGGFKIYYEYPLTSSEVQRTSRRRKESARNTFSLVLTVSSPEAECDSDQPSITTCPRNEPGAIESYRIEVEPTWLRDANIRSPILTSSEEAERHRTTVARKAQVEKAARDALREELESKRQLRVKSEKHVASFLSSLSGVSVEKRNLNSSRYVLPGQSVTSSNQQVMEAGIENRVNRSTKTARALIPVAAIDQLRDGQGNIPEWIDASLIEPLLRPKDAQAFGTIIRNQPRRILCRDMAPKTKTCLSRLDAPAVDNNGGEDNDIAEPTTPGDSNDSSSNLVDPPVPMRDVPSLISDLLKYLSPPELPLRYGAAAGKSSDEKGPGINSYVLETGPADVPALYEFHHLQIAFEDIWQELFDHDTVEAGKTLYEKLVELDLEPALYVGLEEDAVGSNAPAAPVVIPKDNPPDYVLRAFDITPQQWAILKRITPVPLPNPEPPAPPDPNAFFSQFMSPQGALYISPYDYRTQLSHLAELIMTQPDLDQAIIAKLKQAGDGIIHYADRVLADLKTEKGDEKFDQYHYLLKTLRDRLKVPYKFSIYAANRQERSINFGLVTTYRQKWEPQAYQVGKMVKSIPLAPKEVRRYSKKVSIKRSRAEKEVEKSMQSRRTESSETSRVETEIIQKAMAKTNFALSAKGGVDIGIANASGASSFGHEASTESQEVKKAFREAVFKASEEYKSERETEVSVSTTDETASEDSGEISNPNDEITVTYAFYELQRTYRISEEIHSQTPVILVAQEFPNPAQIDEDWIITYDWILRRVILDDLFLDALNYLGSGQVVGDEFALQELFKNVEQQRKIHDETKEQLILVTAQTGTSYQAVQNAMEHQAKVLAGEEDTGDVPVPLGPFGVIFGGGAEASPDAAQRQYEAKRDAYDRLVSLKKEYEDRLQREITALNALTETYTKMLAAHLSRKSQIARLQVHLKQNIMYYMQAIWSHEPPDQRYFRLHQVQVPILKGKKSYKLVPDPDGVPLPPDWTKPWKLQVKCEIDPKSVEYKPLQAVADLDNLLGFKGNYMMFPLKEQNDLTEFMMAPYFDAYSGLRDPDELGNWSLSEFARYVCCLHEKLTNEDFNHCLPGLMETYQRILGSTHSSGDTIVVPTDSLYIDAIPGAHPILEGFKLAHRAIDVKKAQAEVRSAELENLRLASRLNSGERDDPTIDKKVVVEGSAQIIPEP